MEGLGACPQLRNTLGARGRPHISTRMPAWATSTLVQGQGPDAPVEELTTHWGLLKLKRCYRQLTALAKAHRPGPHQQWRIELVNAWRATVRRSAALGPLAPELPIITPHVAHWANIAVSAQLSASHVNAVARAKSRELAKQRTAGLPKALDDPPEGAGLCFEAAP